MALVVEDGTGLDNANSVVSLAEALVYHTDRQTASWLAASDTERSAALIKATDFVKSSFTWPGFPLIATQALPWPATQAYYYNTNPPTPLTGVPTEVKQAVMQLAPYALDEDLEPAADRGGQIIRKRESASIVSEETEWAAGAPASRTYPFLTKILAPIILGSSSGSVSWLRRA